MGPVADTFDLMHVVVDEEDPQALIAQGADQGLGIFLIDLSLIHI